MMRLDIEQRTGTELPANSCLWPWLIRHGGWVDARFRVKRNGATPYPYAYNSEYTSELLLFGELVLFRNPLVHCLTPDAQIKREQPTEVTAVGTCGRWDKDNTHISVTGAGREIARTVRRPPPSERVDVSLLKRVKELPWNGQGLVRRGRPPTLTLERRTMAEAGETLRTSRVERGHLRLDPSRIP